MTTFGIVLYCICFAYLSTAGVVNVALNKPAEQSSTYGSGTLSAGGAVDGDTSTRWPNLINTAEYEPLAWWTLDLQREVQDATVKVYFRTDYKYRRNGVQIYTSDTPFSSYPDGRLCRTFSGKPDGTNIPNIVSVNCSGAWRYLMLYTKTENDDTGPVLDFGEVKVLGCDGTYGKNCDKLCSSRQCFTTPTSCDRYSGSCPPGGCKAGWKGTDCLERCDGSYGLNCSKSCSSRQCAVTSASCDQYTGACPAGGCKSGWMGMDCSQKCTAQTYGQGCYKRCDNRNCMIPSESCHHVSGPCFGGCLPGWNGSDCTHACPDGTYGFDCNNSCGKCACGDICNHVTGKCPGGCMAGWRGSRCNETCKDGTFGVNCMGSCDNCAGLCDVIDGRCLQGCREGYSGDQCRLTNTAKADAGDTSFVTAYVIGAVIGVVVTIVITGGIYLCCLKCNRVKCRRSSGSEHADPLVVMSDVAAVNDFIDFETKADGTHQDVKMHETI